jgi:hypothetical protein
MRLSTSTRPSPSCLVRWGRGRGRGREWGGWGRGQVERQLHDAAGTPSSSASAAPAHPPFVWHSSATSDDHRRISEDLSYFPRFLSDTQQRTLLNAALERLDHLGSYANASRSRRKRLPVFKSTTDTGTDTDTDNTSLSFLPDEYYDFEQVSLILIGSRAPLSPSYHHSGPL